LQVYNSNVKGLIAIPKIDSLQSYYYRLKVENSSGISYSTIDYVNTQKIYTKQFISNIKESINMKGTPIISDCYLDFNKNSTYINYCINPNSATTVVMVEYDTQPGKFIHDSLAKNIGSGNSIVKGTIIIPNLEFNKKYYYHIHAYNGLGSSYSIDKSFEINENN
jgi:hypothetical protein